MTPNPLNLIDNLCDGLEWLEQDLGSGENNENSMTLFGHHLFLASMQFWVLVLTELHRHI